ncbi:hypothetical protein S40288_05815 [Stachybotrys chartarum IBT 40288]|nr:hypothetical protein S40288_05815 [Stachybotrys chartarum IBT 40288]
MTTVKQDVASTASAMASVKAPAAALQPIALLDNPASKPLAAARPAALLALLALGFRPLVADPAWALRAALPVVAAVQAAYAVVCLPAAGSQHAKPAKKPRPGEKKRAEYTGPNSIVAAVLSLLLTAIVTPAVHLLFVLFGAPFLDHVPHTLLCSAHFALLGLFPVFYTRGVDSEALLALAGASAPLDETFGALVGGVLGAWLGAVPIPLDWDREWQKWPVTIVVGVYIGSALVSKSCGALPFLYGRRLRASEDVKQD